ncbi:hypothetical protein CEXT_150411 [Caerostris extrusa]|uniref:Uncharacterized protein n=1 Tax=Caerostris extrusa TaxID=172846 RepID=A0AAV4XFH1_CAEEX|nr:hypothetical protein CEXT_150411 [Caerostris extrusa]
MGSTYAFTRSDRSLFSITQEKWPLQSSLLKNIERNESNSYFGSLPQILCRKILQNMLNKVCVIDAVTYLLQTFHLAGWFYPTIYYCVRFVIIRKKFSLGVTIRLMCQAVNLS